MTASRGRRPATGHINVLHRPVLYQILHHDPWLFIDELVSRLNDHPVVHGAAVYNDWHVFRQLKVDGFSLKKMRKFASERDEAERNVYWAEMTQLVWFPAQLVFIDETSKDGRTLRRSHGRSLTGAEIQQRETILRGRRISILGVFTVSGFIDWHMVERGYSAEEFLYAVEYHVLPHLNTYPAPNSILVRNALVIMKPNLHVDVGGLTFTPRVVALPAGSRQLPDPPYSHRCATSHGRVARCPSTILSTLLLYR